MRWEEHRHHHRKLSFIKIAHGRHKMLGPVSLQVGQKTTATVKGFDQFGAPFTIDFIANPVSWTDSTPALASISLQADGSAVIAGVATGTDNLTAVCAGFTDTEVVTVLPGAPVLASIKIDFTTPV